MNFKNREIQLAKGFIQPYLKNPNRVIARHVEKSPFAEFYSHEKTTFGIYADRFFPISLKEKYLGKVQVTSQQGTSF